MIWPSSTVTATDGPGRAKSVMDIVMVGLTITSSWGNGHATTYRGLVRELARRGHRVLFLEHDQPWYAKHRDLPTPPYGRTELYASVDDLKRRFARELRSADAVIVGSCVHDGVEVGEWVTAMALGVTAFYDLDTPVTLAKLARGDYAYLHPDQVPKYRVYFSYTGGPTLTHLEQRYASPAARPLYCSVDPDLYHPDPERITWDMGYIGTYSADRQGALERLLLEPARRCRKLQMAVAGPMYPETVQWPANVAF